MKPIFKQFKTGTEHFVLINLAQIELMEPGDTGETVIQLRSGERKMVDGFIMDILEEIKKELG